MKNKKIVLLAICSIILFVVLVSAAVVIVLYQKEVYDTTRPYPLQKAEQKEKQPVQKQKLANGYIYKNEDKLKVFNYDTYFDANCIPQNEKNFKTENVRVEYNDYQSFIIKNVNENVGKNKEYDKALKFFNKILNDTTVTDKELLDNEIYLVYGPGCGRSPTSDGVLKELEYSGTEQSKLILRYGSRHAALDSDTLPLEIQLLSKINDDFNIIKATLLLKDYLKDSTELKNCEDNEGNISMYDIKANSCVLNLVNNRLDEVKFQTKIDDILKIFELKI